MVIGVVEDLVRRTTFHHNGFFGGRMQIALDYDYTYILDPSYWDDFIVQARAATHKVLIISTGYVSDGENILATMNGKVDGVVFTNGMKKKPYMVFKDGRRVDVWIDANPESII